MRYKNICVFESDKIILSRSLFEYDAMAYAPNKPMAEFQIRLFKKGGFIYANEDKQFSIGDNFVVITHPGENYYYSYDENCSIDRYHIRFSPEVLTSDIMKDFPYDLFVFPVEEDSVISELFAKIDYYCLNFDGERLETVLLHILEEIIFNLVLISRKKDFEVNHTSNPLFSEIISFIDKNIRNPLTLDDICEEFYISKSYLHHIFDKQLHISPKKYIISKKLSNARMDIRNGKNPSSLYSEYGFQNYSGFYRAYIKLFGYSPSEENKCKRRDYNSVFEF